MKPKTITRIGVAIYILSALAFLEELVGEITGFYLLNSGWIVHEMVELATLVGFIIGGLLLWYSHRVLHARNAEVERLLRAAKGEFTAMLQALFAQWSLTEAEQDIALLTVRGMTVAEIAEARNTSQGTVKSQNNAIYRKAGVKNRTQLVGAVVEELLVGPDDQHDHPPGHEDAA
ncbi:regulatory protein, luxR family [Aliiroseovarius sediminilitoris]|uniref:Regulatory protein, luxR family n=1 Tax=Aliiroseovarius sediminilitoris TaxID=1173584 RepID=A0A1I0P6A1_9RHOB|nr:helix-turn-helix transcriptional regulator [Aliiroseovarius sediminilitoris]SEW09779.1 regulatory protein, luxR family [Aliiroseovarius sediminilitoris]